VHVDPAHLETALLNLAVNARDAMANGGSLTVAVGVAEGDDLPAVAREAGGDWARIDVIDDGAGMPQAVLDHIFEPFFTTKDVGKGSGLGLSQVYGFMHQTGGQIAVQSAPGEGTRFSLFLPATEAPLARRAAAPSGEVQGGSESILVVEDDPAVLAVNTQMLEGLGYNILTAANGAEALKKLRGKKPIDLLFTDVVMPGGMNGGELAEMAQDIRPGLKILLTSGYVGDHAAVVRTELPLINKPYEKPQLAAKLRSLLDELDEADAFEEVADDEPRSNRDGSQAAAG